MIAQKSRQGNTTKSKAVMIADAKSVSDSTSHLSETMHGKHSYCLICIANLIPQTHDRNSKWFIIIFKCYYWIFATVWLCPSNKG